MFSRHLPWPIHLAVHQMAGSVAALIGQLALLSLDDAVCTGVFIRTWDMSWGLRTQGGRESGWGYRKSHLGWDMTHTIFIDFIYTCTQACWHPVDSCLAFPAGAHIFSRAPSPEFREAEHQWEEMAEILGHPFLVAPLHPQGPETSWSQCLS